MSLYVNVKTFALAAIKPLVLALKQRYDYQVKAMFERVNDQDDKLLKMQTMITEMNKNISVGTTAYMDAIQEIADMRNRLYTSDEVKELDRRCRQLEVVVVELYALVQNKLPGEELPSLDPWLPEDPLPTAKYFEDKWRVELGVDPDVELTEEQQKLADEYIYRQYLTFPRIPDYPEHEDGTLLTDEEVEEYYRKRNSLAGDAELTEDQQEELQAYLDAYQYVYRYPEEQEEVTPEN